MEKFHTDHIEELQGLKELKFKRNFFLVDLIDLRTH